MSMSVLYLQFRANSSGEELLQESVGILILAVDRNDFDAQIGHFWKAHPAKDQPKACANVR